MMTDRLKRGEKALVLALLRGLAEVSGNTPIADTKMTLPKPFDR